MATTRCVLCTLCAVCCALCAVLCCASLHTAPLYCQHSVTVFTPKPTLPSVPTPPKKNQQVRTSNHVLLLNWNSQSPAILRQIAAAQATGRGGEGRLEALVRGAWRGKQQVVILADKPKAEMDVVVYETLRWGWGWGWVGDGVGLGWGGTGRETHVPKQCYEVGRRPLLHNAPHNAPPMRTRRARAGTAARSWRCTPAKATPTSSATCARWRHTRPARSCCCTQKGRARAARR